MATTIVTVGRTAEQFVLTRYPTAFAHDDGESVQIKVRETEVVSCPCCNQKYTRDKHIDLMPTIGHAGNASDAWKNARNRLRLH